MAELGVDTVVELGAGRVLIGLAKRTVPEVSTVALGAPEEIDAFVATLPH
jgi:[acyl-carrier-protein] S-malonyltransferase